MKESEENAKNENDPQPDQPDKDITQSEGHISDESAAPKGVRVRRRIKVRKRLRVRQKPSIKKKLKKFAEKAFWVVIVAGFITALVIMIIELDIRDEKFKQKKKSGTVKIEF